ncbi:probable serine/threonine-protein kinase PBL11 [Primulina eburnea]|uniref:probable serine/threonine-protein kinase PBL11 n=1 Tax=Primulina eburnea TaxID=1245227 RepID=UPI003C6BFD48
MNPLDKLTYDVLSRYTNSFSESKCIGHFQFGKFYRKKFNCPDRERHFVVKIWETGYNVLRLADEVILLRHEMMLNHPSMVQMYGFCADGEHLGVMYEFQASDSVYNLIPKDSFTWLQRIKVALGIASLLKFLHTGYLRYSPLIVRNLDAAHVLLDENGYPRLCDFSMVTGGILPDRTVHKNDHVNGCYSHIDPYAGKKGKCSDKQDVFAYGVILLGLITKKVYTGEDWQAQLPFVHEWAQREYIANESDSVTKATRRSLVHESLTKDPDFDSTDGAEITTMAMECINVCDHERPTMKQVLRSLLTLPVVKQHAPFLGVNKLLHPHKNGH